MLVVDAAGVTYAPGVPVEGPIDIVGAGDSAVAGLASALCAGATPVEAALVGNLAASVTVRQLGTTGTASRAQMLQAFEAWARVGVESHPARLFSPRRREVIEHGATHPGTVQ
ncbi:MAG: PfkB family carbohydrate kinase [Anaerolineae bacterium]|nr:PfkB family carbohydrate kinase [Anaerolineae bacterium]